MKNKLSRAFDHFSNTITKATGSSAAFLIACTIILLWALTGPIFHYSDTWQLVINTGTTIITFLMVFVIQQSQNKDTMALHIKLNELIASHENSSNRLISVEDLTEEELVVLKKFYSRLGTIAKNEKSIFTTHSIDEAELNAMLKQKMHLAKKQKRLKKDL